MLSARDLLAEQAMPFLHVGGDLEASARDCRLPHEAGPASLVFVSDAAQLASAAAAGAAIVVARRELKLNAETLPAGIGCFFTVSSIPMAMALLLPAFDRKAARFTQWGERHPTAVVHESAVIGAGTSLGPYCVIGAGAHIGEHCSIGSHTVVENEARIGPRTRLHPHVFIGAGCLVGADCEIHPHTTIGSDGFGYAVGPGGRPRKIPHLGIVTIGDAVEIGGNCSIDRGTLASTYVRAGAKIDNLCHIAHNCDLGEDGFYTAGFMMAGSTTIGKRFMTGGNSVVSAHLTIADDVVLAGRSTVTNDIAESGQYGGYPLQPLKDALKTLVSLGQLNDIRRNLNRVMKQVGLG
jgi:UDP-3-O-[3-hydroxymyristoyl] glucosamine N-acyltransferase